MQRKIPRSGKNGGLANLKTKRKVHPLTTSLHTKFEFMEEWKTYRFGDICDIFGRIGFRGYTSADLVERPEDGAISLSPTNIIDGKIELSKPTYISWNKYYESPEIMLGINDIVLSKTATIGRTALIDELAHPMTLNPQLVVLKNIKVNPVFFSYFLKGPLFQGLLNSITVGSVIPTLSQKNLSNLIIKLPPLSVQERIARVLQSFDSKIKLNNRINHNLEEQAKALYKSWFIDFEPFKDGKFVDSELGMIPEGWHVGTLSELLEVRYGKDHKKLSDGRIPVYGSGGLMRYADRALFESESVLIPRKGTLNNVMYVSQPFWTVDTMFYTIGKTKHVIKYAHLFLLTQDLSSMNAGSAVPSMTTDILNKLPVLIPSHEALRPFDAIVAAFYSLIGSGQIENSLLASTRDSILPQLMSGAININSLTC